MTLRASRIHWNIRPRKKAAVTRPMTKSVLTTASTVDDRRSPFNVFSGPFGSA